MMTDSVAWLCPDTEWGSKKKGGHLRELASRKPREQLFGASRGREGAGRPPSFMSNAWPLWDSNPRLSAYEAPALTAELKGHSHSSTGRIRFTRMKGIQKGC